MPLVLKTLKTFFLAKTRYRYYRIHTSNTPMPPDTPLRNACDSSGLRAAPPPPAKLPIPPPPPAPTPPPRKFWQIAGGGCCIRTSCSRPPRAYGTAHNEWQRQADLSTKNVSASP